MAVGIGIVGCGRVVERRIAPAVREADNAELVAFCSRNLDRACQFRDQHGADRAYDALVEMLDDPDVHAVYVGTPNSVHAVEVLDCLAGGKHVLVDKPMAPTAAQCREMIESANRRRLTLGVLHQQRFHPANQQLARWIEEGRLGKLTMVRIGMGVWYPPAETWRLEPRQSGGGVAMDLGPHAIDILRQLAGEVASVNAMTANVQFHYEVEDFCAARLAMDEGPVGLLDLSYCSHAYGGRVEVYGSEASAAADGSMQQIGDYRLWFRRGNTSNPVELVEDRFEGAYTAAIEEFADAIDQRRAPAVTAADGLATLEVIEAIYESARTGQTVSL